MAALGVTIPVVYPSGEDGWHSWNSFRRICGNTNQLTVALKLTNEMTTVPDRWCAEPVHHVIVPTDIFVKNNNGYPVLPKAHQQFLTLLFSHFKAHVVVDLVPTKDEDDKLSDVSNYVNYIARLFQQRPEISAAEVFGLSYRDYLQAPLQPLQDNLESQTYETFEKDPVKYVQYEEAVFRCIEDKEKRGKRSLVLMVVGAGRGPLVQACLNAAERANCKDFEVWAVEKNPNAVITLRHKKKDEVQWAAVTIIHEDMRSWRAPKKADIMVSELLGSFGDNELSPECLDGAQRFLAEDGVSIPEHYELKCLFPPETVHLIYLL